MLTAVVLYCGESFLSRCLLALSFCDRVLIIADREDLSDIQHFASDRVQIISQRLEDDFALQRNRADQHIKEGWIVHIDADEVVPKELATEILSAVKSDRYSAYFLRRHDVFLGRELKRGEVSTAASQGFIRLYKKGAGIWKGAVHEQYTTNSRIGALQQPIMHYAHESITDFLHSVNYYSTLRAQELRAMGTQGNVLQLIVYPPVKFLYTFVLKGGWREGAEGFIYSFLMSFHSFLVRAKLY